MTAMQDVELIESAPIGSAYRAVYDMGGNFRCDTHYRTTDECKAAQRLAALLRELLTKPTTEPRGCPMPGACSCVPQSGADDGELRRLLAIIVDEKSSNYKYEQAKWHIVTIVAKALGITLSEPEGGRE